VLSVDSPSGPASDLLDFGGAVVAADFTVTLTAPKVGNLFCRIHHAAALVVRDRTPPELLESDSHLKFH
jgi:NAD(P)H-hydrate repair Nnr-like enzyme with NAD(P)H-hydrate epimerase domain